jgi:solute carrier family 25 carnitine/acylcarnitine transporter 20/29
VSKHASLSYFNNLLPSSLKNILANSSELTLFLPQDSAWKSLDDVQRRYLESEFAEDDMQKILGMHSVWKNSVKWSDTFKDSKKCK